MGVAVCAALGCIAYGAAGASAASVWDESVDGDLSGDRFAPTPLSLSPGVNSVTATSTGGDLEYYTFTLPPGQQLENIFLFSYDTLDDVSFIGVQNGTVFTEPNIGADPANLLGWTHFGFTGQVGLDLLPDIGAGFDAQGFTPPLPSGSYAWWSQQTSPITVTTYQLDFVVSPEPGMVSLFIIGGMLLARRRR
jgi:hypothetical protein